MCTWVSVVVDQPFRVSIGDDQPSMHAYFYSGALKVCIPPHLHTSRCLFVCRMGYGNPCSDKLTHCFECLLRCFHMSRSYLTHRGGLRIRERREIPHEQKLLDTSLWITNPLTTRMAGERPMFFTVSNDATIAYVPAQSATWKRPTKCESLLIGELISPTRHIWMRPHMGECRRRSTLRGWDWRRPTRRAIALPYA